MTSSDYTGIHAFMVIPFPTGTYANPSSDEPRSVATEITVGGDQASGFFRTDINGSATYGLPGVYSITSRADELEGTTVYRGTDGLMYVLLMVLANEPGEDDVSLHWWYTNEP